MYFLLKFMKLLSATFLKNIPGRLLLIFDIIQASTHVQSFSLTYKQLF